MILGNEPRTSNIINNHTQFSFASWLFIALQSCAIKFKTNQTPPANLFPILLHIKQPRHKACYTAPTNPGALRQIPSQSHTQNTAISHESINLIWLNGSLIHQNLECTPQESGDYPGCRLAYLCKQHKHPATLPDWETIPNEILYGTCVLPLVAIHMFQLHPRNLKVPGSERLVSFWVWVWRMG